MNIKTTLLITRKPIHGGERPRSIECKPTGNWLITWTDNKHHLMVEVSYKYRTSEITGTEKYGLFGLFKRNVSDWVEKTNTYFAHEDTLSVVTVYSNSCSGEL